MQIPTWDEVQAEVAARAAALGAEVSEEERAAVQVQARDEALERLCGALGYLQRSLEEVEARRAKLAAEVQAVQRVAVQAKGDVVQRSRALEEMERQREGLHQDLVAEREKQRRAFAEVQALRAELRSVHLALIELNRQTEAADATCDAQGSAPSAG